jgi:hypothetical protein
VWWACVAAQQLLQELSFLARRYTSALQLQRTKHLSPHTADAAGATLTGLHTRDDTAQVPQRVRPLTHHLVVSAVQQLAKGAGVVLPSGLQQWTASNSEAARAQQCNTATHTVQQFSTATDTVEGGLQPPEVVFTLELQPTDPVWERGPITLCGHVRPAAGLSGARAGLLAVSLCVSRATPLQTWLRAAIDKTLRLQV